METSTVCVPAQENLKANYVTRPSGALRSPSQGQQDAFLSAPLQCGVTVLRGNSDKATSAPSSSAYKLALRHDAYVELQSLHMAQKAVSRTSISRCLDLALNGGPEVHEFQSGAAQLVNLARCRDKLCLFCCRKRAADAAAKISSAMAQGVSEGSRLGFLTIGVNSADAHDVGKAYSDLLGLWQKTFQTRWIRKVGLSHFVRSLDYTARTNGTWNLHWHAVFVIPEWVKEGFSEIYDVVYERWSRFAKKAGLKTAKGGNKFVEVEAPDKLSDYVSGKFNALELVSASTKESRNLSLLDILSLVREGDEQGKAMYWNLESGLKGRRALGYSADMNALYARALEREEECVELKEPEDKLVNVVKVPPDVWAWFKLVRALIVPAFILQGSARQYFIELCALYNENHLYEGEDISMAEHIKYFKMLYNLDRRNIIKNLSVS